MSQVIEYSKQENYTKAIEELSWLKKALQKLHLNKLESFFANDLNGYEGQQVANKTAFGFSTISRKYVGENNSVNVVLMRGESSRGLAALREVATLFQGGKMVRDTFRIKGRAAVLESRENDMSSLTVSLKSGASLRFDISGDVDHDVLRTMGESFPIEQLDDYLLSGK